MDSIITAAARALTVGDPLGALKRVSLREDPHALALRGIAMAQLGDFPRARALLRRAARAFGPKEALARARCLVAEAEIALVSRDLGWSAKALDLACLTLEEHGDAFNAAHARHLIARRQLLTGQINEAERILSELNPASLPPVLRTAHELVVAGIAMRRLNTNAARAALARARCSAYDARIPVLMTEVESASLFLRTPAARLIRGREENLLRLEEIEALMRSGAVIVDACRYAVRDAYTAISLTGRPVLFMLARVLAEAWPEDVPRDVLLARAFGAKLVDESHRMRLRVEIARLRKALRPFAEIQATRRGFCFLPHRGREVVVLTWPEEQAHAELLAFLADGESWSSSALALALRTSQRTVQRALDSLAEAGRIQSFGRGRSRRWMTPPMPGFAITLLLTSPYLGE